MYNFSKKQVFITSGIIVLLIAVSGATMAGVHERFEKKQGSFYKGGEYQSERNEQENIARTVASTASGADITFTPVTSADSGTLSILNAEFQILRGSQALQNSSFKADVTESSGALKVSVTSNIPDVVKLIQEKATSGESGMFGVNLLGESNISGSNGGKEGRGYKEKESRGRGNGNRE